MASKVPKIFQSLRTGINKLLGGSPAQTKGVEVATKNPTEKPNHGGAAENLNHDPFMVIDPRSNYPERPVVPPMTRAEPKKNVEVVNRASDTAATNKAQNPATNHDPFMVIDPRSNYPERPVNPTLPDLLNPTITRSKQNKNFEALKNTSDVNISLNKEDEKKVFIDNNFPERIIIPDITTKSNTGTNEIGKDTNTSPDIVSVLSTVKHTEIEGSGPSIEEHKAKTADVEIKRKPLLKFEAMTPIRQVIQPHTPLIRFRKGIPPTHDNMKSPQVELANQSDLAQSNTNKLELVMSSTSINKGMWKSSPILHEWWDTPKRFKRRQLDDIECDIINGGGCDEIYQ